MTSRRRDRPNAAAPAMPQQRAQRAFTLIELMVVIGIIALLMILVVPAVTNLKTAGDVTNAAYTVKGVLEEARTYARTNNTYTWVGFFEEDGSKSSTTPATAGNGRLVMSTVASKDGSQGFKPGSNASASNFFDITKVAQIGKLVKIDNVHLPLFASGTGTGDTFDTRPIPDSNGFTGSNDSRFGELNATTPTAPTTNSKFPFQYPVGNPTPPAQYTFNKTLQFNPRGECRINGTFDIRRIVEIGLVQTHADAIPTPTTGAGTSAVVFPGNTVAIQITGFASIVKIYRR
jgi:prepilin-type N-terminal cleavage/methylation domain-containing protein